MTHIGAVTWCCDQCGKLAVTSDADVTMTAEGMPDGWMMLSSPYRLYRRHDFCSSVCCLKWMNSPEQVNEMFQDWTFHSTQQGTGRRLVVREGGGC